MVGEEEQTERHEVIEISFPAQAAFVILARFAAATMAARAGFDVEEIEDLRLAVDELYVSLGPMTEHGCVRMELDCARDVLSIVATFERSSSTGAEINDDIDDSAWKRAAELSQLLLESLVDEHGDGIRDGKPAAWLRKRRTIAQ
jgi:hypothetical protein